MLLSFHCINWQITPSQNYDSYSHLRHCRLSTICPSSKLHRQSPLRLLPSFSRADASVSRGGEESEFGFVSEKEPGFSFDGSFELTDLKRFDSPTVEVTELEELPDQWKRSKLAWLCKELPSHRSGTFIRVLNAQRKWIRQHDCTYIAVHFTRIRDNEAAFRVYEWMMRQHWFQFDFALATKLADYLGKERKYLKCREIYDHIVNRGLVPNESTFHILIVAYLSSSVPSCLDEACGIYNQMIHLGGYKPRLSLHNSLFKALVSKPGKFSKHHFKQAEFIFQNMSTCGLKIHSNIYEGLIWLHSYQDTVDTERIASLRAEMKSSGIEESAEVLLSVLRACSREGDLAEAERTWKRILSSNKKPPTVAFMYLMEVYSSAGLPRKSLEIFRGLQQLGFSGAVPYYKIIQIFCKAQDTEQAESLLTEFISSGLKPLTRSFVDMMRMYAELGFHDKLESTFHRCLERCRPNQTVYNLYLKSLVKTNHLDKADGIFNHMYADETIGVDNELCNTILRGYLDCGHYAKAEAVYKLMCEKKYDVDSSLMKKLESILSLHEEEMDKPVRPPKLSKEQREILTGLLLGGLRVNVYSENKSYGILFVFRDNFGIHSVLKRHIYNQFHEWLTCKSLVGDEIPCQFTTISHSYFKFYADKFWPQGQHVIPTLIHRWLTPRVLAYWYMYGGYRTSSGDILLRLNFDEDGVQRIAKTMKARGLNCLVKRKGRAFWMGFLGSEAMELWKVIEPFVIADLKESLEAGISATGSSNLSSGSSDGKSSDDYANLMQ